MAANGNQRLRRDARSALGDLMQSEAAFQRIRIGSL